MTNRGKCQEGQQGDNRRGIHGIAKGVTELTTTEATIPLQGNYTEFQYIRSTQPSIHLNGLLGGMGMCQPFDHAFKPLTLMAKPAIKLLMTC